MLLLFGADEICQAYIESSGFMAKLPVEDSIRGVKTPINILGFLAGGAKYPRRGVPNILQSDGGSSFPEGVLDFLGKIAWGCQFSCDTGLLTVFILTGI